MTAISPSMHQGGRSLGTRVLAMILGVLLFAAGLALIVFNATRAEAAIDYLGPQPNEGETICYTIADNSTGIDDLVVIRDASTNPTITGIGTIGTDSVEALAIRPGYGIYAFDPITNGGQLILLNASTGATAQVFGSNLGATDIDGMTFANVANGDPTDDVLWVTIRVVDAPDQIAQMDPNTGAIIAGPIDILTAGLGVTEDVDDIAWDPASGNIYGVVGAQGANTLIIIDPTTGSVTPVGAMATVDIEGLGFSNVGGANGTLYATTGVSGNPADTFWETNKADGTTTNLADIAAATGWIDFEAMDCISAYPGSSVGNVVWFDTDGDGVQDPGEAGVQGVSVTIYDAAGNVIDTAVTGPNGEYNFLVAPGDYYVQFDIATLPTGAVPTVQNAGQDDTTDSDADPVSGRTATFSIADGQIDPTWDLGIVGVESVGGATCYAISEDGVAPNTLIKIEDDGNGGWGLSVVGVIPNANLTEALAIRPGSGIYTWNTGTGLFIISENDASIVQAIGSPNATLDIDGLTFANTNDADPGNDILYGTVRLAGSDELVTIDPATGAVTSLGPVDVSAIVATNDIDDIAWDPANNTLYATAGSSGENQLVSIDPATLTATPIGALTNDVEGLGYGAVGQAGAPLFAVTGAQGAQGSVFLIIDQTTGASTVQVDLDNTAPVAPLTDFESIDCVPIELPTAPAIGLEKATNGIDADTAPGPQLVVGEEVTWTYVVSNAGTEALSNVSLGDDIEGAITCPQNTLAVGESMTCTLVGTAVAGQYENVATVTAQSPAGVEVGATDPSHYTALAPAIDIEKSTNGDDADAAPGPTIIAGETVTWTYLVKNIGTVPLTNVTVTDDVIGAITCPESALDVNESMTCIVTGIATNGQYENLGTVVGDPADANGNPIPGVPQVDDTDPSHYFGESTTAIDIEKATNGSDADEAPGPSIAVDGDVTWTYLVTNIGTTTLSNIVVTDDIEGVITCPKATLVALESMTCEATGVATAGQYENEADVVGTDPDGGPATDVDPSHYFGAEPGITLQKSTDGEDADNAPGPVITPGATVTWTYLVTNTGNVTLTDIVLTDDMEGAITCPQTSLAAGANMTCTTTGIATDGQYENTATVEGTDPDGVKPSASDPSHYFGANPSIELEKATNTDDADDTSGPFIPVGGEVTWTYVVTNNGNTTLTNIALTDDIEGAITCPQTALAAGANMTCTATGTATAGQYENNADVVGLPVGPDNNPLPGFDPADPANWPADADPSHYFGADPSIELEKATNTIDADVAPGPSINEGGAVEWTYLVSNTGNVTLDNIALTDDIEGAITCPQTSLAAGANMTCTATGTAIAGQYENMADVAGLPVDEAGVPIPGFDPANPANWPADADPSHYFGEDPSIDVEKATNTVDADAAPGPTVPVGDTVTWTYVVKNDGNVPLTAVALTDDIEGDITCPKTALAVDESMTCTLEGTAEIGQYENRATVVGTSPGGESPTDEDPSHYVGEPDPSIDIEKATNGSDADSAPGPSIALDGDVTWTYIVKNTGNVTLTSVAVTDDVEGAITCPQTTLAVGESMTCEATGTAAAGQYENDSDVVGTPSDPAGTPIPGVPNVTDEDPSHYFGAQPGLGLEKATNTIDADNAPGPYLSPGDDVTWTYVVENTGNVEISQIELVDDVVGPITCPQTTLAAGTTMTCEATGTATLGQYENTATVSGVDPDGGQPSASDPSHYFGANPSIEVEKATNTDDADDTNGPLVAAGGEVEWTYVVNNTGNVTLDSIALTDDIEGAITCPQTSLAAGATMTCTLLGTANPGQYENVADVAGLPVDDAGTPLPGFDPADPANWPVDEDPSHYFGSDPELEIVKTTNGDDGLTIPVGDPVVWTYVVTNSGNVLVDSIAVVDNIEGAIACPQTSLNPGESMTCELNGVAELGEYVNNAVVTGTDPVGTPVDDEDPSSYIGEPDPSIVIEKATNGADADEAPGPAIPTDETVTWTYVVENTGNVTLTSVTVTDDIEGAITCPKSTLAVGESMTCEATGAATSGQYENNSDVVGTPSDPDGTPIPDAPNVTDEDPSHYFGTVPGLSLDKATNTIDADTAPGPALSAGDVVTWTYVVKNTGNVEITNIALVDDIEGPVTCPQDTLAAGGTMQCTLTGTVKAGDYENIATVTGIDPDGGEPSASDPSHYFGADPSIELEKATNTLDADTATGPLVAVGDTVTWTYVVENTGNVTLNDITLTDDIEGAVTCPETSLAAGAIMTCTATGTATAGQYENVADVAGLPVDEAGAPIPGFAPGDPANWPADEDPSHYFGVDPMIDVEKATNGEDADTPTGPQIPVGGIVTWTYVVSNSGNVPMTNITLADNLEGTISCPETDLAVGGSMTCTATGTATAGQYANMATVVGLPVDASGDPLPGVDPDNDATWPADEDPSHYIGVDGALGNYVWIDLNEDGIQDDDEPPVEGVTVNLWTDDDGDGTPDTQLATTMTAADGSYLFPDLDPGVEYIVQFDVPNNPFTSADAGGDDAADSDADPTTGITGPNQVPANGSNLDVDAGLLPAGLGDYVWVDLNEDGLQDDGEPPIEGVVVRLYVDADGDGEPDSTMPTANALTNGDGYYEFLGLDPTVDYVVEFVSDALTIADAGDDGDDSNADPATGFTTAISLDFGDFDPTIDAGVLPAGLGDTVWFDNDADGVQDADEEPVEGVEVTLFDADGNVVATTTTNADGFYEFTGLDPQLSYVVEFDAELFTAPNQGANDAADSDVDPDSGQTAQITLDPGEYDPTIDAGILTAPVPPPPVSPQEGEPASLGNFAWLDADADGEQDADEEPVEGALVELYVADENGVPVGQPIASALTDADGAWLFDDLDPDLDYVVSVTPPTGLVVTQLDAGIDDAADSDIDPISGFSAVISLEPGQDDPTIDIGLTPMPASLGSTVWLDEDGDGAQDNGEPGISGVTVNLWEVDENGIPLKILGTMETNATGDYAFAGLDPTVDYIVEFIAPDGSSFTTPNAVMDAADSDAGPNGLTAVVNLDPGEDDPKVDAGILPKLASIDVEKSTNGIDGDDPEDRPELNVGDPVTWTFVVTNTGEWDLVDVEVVDDIEGFVCTIDFLAVGESATCELEGTATAGAYENQGSAAGQPVDGAGEPAVQLGGSPLIIVSDDDPSGFTGTDVLPTSITAPPPRPVVPLQIGNSPVVFAAPAPTPPVVTPAPVPAPAAAPAPRPTSPAPSPSPAPPLITPQVTVNQPPPPLAVTGVNSGVLITIAIGLMLAGMALLFFSRRRNEA